MSSNLIQNIALSRIKGKEGYVRSRIEYTIPSDVMQITVNIPESSTVDEIEGFTMKNESTFIWQNNSNQPSLNLTIAVDRPGLRSTGTNMVDMGDWAILESPSLTTKWRSRQGQVALEQELTIDDKGVASNNGELVYLGKYTEYTRRSAEQLIRLIEPEAATLAEAPNDILDSLDHAARRLQVSNRDEEVVCIAAPTDPVNWGPGGIHAGGNSFWARDDARLDVPNNTWIHEYVHTCQNFHTDTSMQWIIEAMAVYFGAYLSFNQDLITTEECHAALNPSRYTSEKLGEPSQWSSPRVPYRKGSRVIHWLDHQLRKNSSVSLVDILDMLNTKYKGSITDMPANTKMNNSGDHTLTFESFTEDIEEMLEVDNKIGLIKNINKNLRSAVDGTNITPVTQPMDSGFDDKEINPDPGTISEVEELFDQQTDVTLESDGQNENSSEITDVSDMFDNEENKSSTQQPTNESDSSQNEITDVDDMFD